MQLSSTPTLVPRTLPGPRACVRTTRQRGACLLLAVLGTVVSLALPVSGVEETTDAAAAPCLTVAVSRPEARPSVTFCPPV